MRPMRDVPLFDHDSPVRLAGVLGAEHGAHGRLLSRLSAAARTQIIDPQLLFTASMPSGGRLELTTDATAIEIELVATQLAWGDEPARTSVVDLAVDGALDTAVLEGGPVRRVIDRVTGDYEIIPGRASTARFDGLPPGPKHVEVWLPHNAAVELIALRVDDAASVTPPVTAERRRWVHYGSSISHCAEALRPTGVWPVLVARRRGLDLTSLAIAGQAQLDQFAARTVRDLAPDLISLKVGINIVNADSMRERAFVPAVHGFLDTIRDGLPEVPILLVTPIICPVVEQHPGPTRSEVAGSMYVVDRPAPLEPGALTLERIRELLTTVVRSRQAAGDANLHLRSGLDLFGTADVGDLPDGLHPSPAGYLTIADRFDALAFGEGGPFAA